ncbi:phage tail sheath C-terminal domain-containing protein [Dysosmobacter sp. Phy]
MSEIIHERPGVYSSYDASAVVSGGRAVRTVGVAARAVRGDVGKVVTVTGYTAGVAVFGEDAAQSPGMSTLLRLLFANGAATVLAVRVDDAAGTADYEAAFQALGREEAQILVCDSAELEVQQALRTAVEEASSTRRERIALVGGNGDTAAELVERAAALNSERMVLVGPDALSSTGEQLPGVFSAGALAGVVACGRDPAVPLNGAEIAGLGGVCEDYSDNDIDLLVRGGVTPLECAAGVVSPVRGITTRTTTGGAADTTWRELTTILIVDDVIPAVRQSLRSKFSRTKNTAQTRSAIRSQTVVELEKKLAAEIIDSYGEVTVSASADDPSVCLVEFTFAVAHGLNQIYLTVHITI